MKWRSRAQLDRKPMPIDEVPDDERTRQNVHAAIMIILLFLGGLWLVFAFRNYVKTEECLEAGHRNCTPLDVPIDLQSGRGR